MVVANAQRYVAVDGYLVMAVEQSIFFSEEEERTSSHHTTLNMRMSSAGDV